MVAEPSDARSSGHRRRGTTARETLADTVAEQLKRQILGGRYAPGEKLPPELSLASELGVNRFTVREAMNQLEQLRLIQRRAGIGTVVLDYSQNASVDVIEYLVLNEAGEVNIDLLSGLLETARIVAAEVAGLAAQRRREDDLRALDVVVAQMRSESTLSRLLWLDFDFHWHLAGAAQNLVPRLLMNSVRGLLHKYSHLLETLWVAPGSINAGYEHVVDAVREGDRDRARALVQWIWTGRHQRFLEAARELPQMRPKPRDPSGATSAPAGT